jgi:PST family polysaccharide transporter
MTVMQVIGSFLGIIIYPYLIRTIGASHYGLYIFSLSFTNYFVAFISFGFTIPALKNTIASKNDVYKISEIVSSVFTAKLYLCLISSIIFLVLLYTLPILKSNKLLFIISFTQIIGEVLFPVWYFQAKQKMKIVTYIQVTYRLLSLPIIFLIIKNDSSLNILAAITSLTVILAGITSTLLLIYVEKIKFHIVKLSSLKSYFIESTPFFWASSTGIFKQESITIIIGTFFGMKDVALYDLANKLIVLPRTLTMTINSALFPKIIDNHNPQTISKIIKYETFLGMAIMLAIVILGKWAILLFGGETMMDAYPMAIILSFTVLSWLVVGCYLYFVFVPLNTYSYISNNQMVATVAFFVFCLSGILIFHNIIIVVISISLSGLCEILYCKYLIKKHKLL